MIIVKGKSQYAEDIHPKFRSSACGPVTIFVILSYWFKNCSPFQANDLYKKLFATPIGLFRFILVWRLRWLLGDSWRITPSNRIDEVINELKKGHPVAAKFDKYFTLRFFSKPLYSYHWVVLTGFKIKNGHIYLFFHDNGAKGRESQVRSMLFTEQASALCFVLISPRKTPL